MITTTKNRIANSSTLNFKSQELRLSVLEAIYRSGKGHIGGAFSCTDILVALYYGGILKYDSKNEKWDKRDRFILSKGHAAIALYAVLSDLGYFNKSELELFNNGGMLGEHPDINIPGIEINSGSLGHGLGVGAGMALAAKMDAENYRTFVLLGDGECNEGSVWEAAMFAAHHNLENLTAIIDRNGLCIHGTTEEINRLNPLDKKFESFGWHVETMNGHDIEEIVSKLKVKTIDKPIMIIANTIKGKGVSFMENITSWHHGSISEQQYVQAKKELNNHLKL